MKRKVRVYKNRKYVDQEINYIPIRYIFSIIFAVLEILAIIGVMVLLAMYIPYFYIAIFITVVVLVIYIVASDENPDYKIPWIIAVIGLPIVGMMLYFMFSKRKLPKKLIKKLDIIDQPLECVEHDKNVEELKKENELYNSQALNLCKISDAHLYKNNSLKYYPLGENMFDDMLVELSKAKEFIFLEYFIIEEGKFWNPILEILKEKASNGVEVKLLYDDIGCMSTLPGNYYKKLKQYKINAIPFSRLRGTADGEFNNRSHRKILVIDGLVGFTGGVNVADEYINEIERFGHWKDTGLMIKGNSVNELTRLFLIDYYLNDKKIKKFEFNKYYRYQEIENANNYVIPFGDGPKPIYEKNVGKIAIMNLLNHATKYVYITTPYLIVDNEIMRCIENASLRGVDVRIIIPGIPDKKMVYELAKQSAEILIKSNVKVYTYTPGFIHAKQYIADDKVGIIGTINLDYRSLTHHFENGVWMYDENIIKDLKDDFNDLFEKSCLINENIKKVNIFKRFIRALLKMISPLL
jgi:cardiolipin synthase